MSHRYERQPQRRVSNIAVFSALAALAVPHSAEALQFMPEHEFDPASIVPKNPASRESWREASAFRAGTERLTIPGIPPQKEGDMLEVVHKSRVPKQAKVSFGMLGGRECLAWLGQVERLCVREDGLPPFAQMVKVVFVKLIRPTRKERNALRSSVVEGTS